MKAGVVVAAVAAVSLGAGVVVLRRRRAEEEAAARAAGPAVPAPVAVVKPALDAGAAASAARSGVPSLEEIKRAVASGALSPAGTVAAGLALVNTMGAVAGMVGGQGAADVAGSGIGGLAVGGGVIIGKGAQAVAGALGASQGVASTAGLLTGAGVVLGAPGVLVAGTAKAVGEGARWVIGKAFGESAAKSVSNVAREFDPFLSGSVANKPFKAVSKGVKAVGNFFGKLF